MAVAPAYVSLLPDGKAFHVVGDMKECVLQGTVGAADTYVTNGLVLPAASVTGMQKVAYVDPFIILGHTVTYVPSTGLLQVFSSNGTELVNASAALQNGVFVMTVHGK